MARETELIEGRELCGRIDAPLQRVLVFERAGLGGDDAEHDLLALRQQAQRLEAAGALVVIFHEIAMHVDLVEQDFLHGIVGTRTHVGRFVIAAAQMHRDRHVGRDVGHRDIDEFAVDFAELFRVVAACLHLVAVFRIAQHRDEDFIELQIAAARVREGAHGLAVGLAEIMEETVEIGVDRFIDRGGRRSAIDR